MQQQNKAQLETLDDNVPLYAPQIESQNITG